MTHKNLYEELHMNVAWFGLGQMGLPSARRIAAAGHRVRGYDVNAPNGDLGAIELVPSVNEAVDECDMICIAVFSDDQVEELLTGKDGILKGLKPGTVIAVFTTGVIERIQEIAAQAPEGVTVLDTCFSRKPEDGPEGMLTLLVGGDATAIDAGRPVFDTFCNVIIHVGPSGSGRAIKLVNNILFAGHLQLAADALNFATGLGLDPQTTANALTKCSGASSVLGLMAVAGPEKILESTDRYMMKDVAAAEKAASDRGITLGPIVAATQAYRK
jgi:3-hydroxyisobutyrate dehydrogenase-like beta-hydroxyacid dehydrogenase